MRCARLIDNIQHSLFVSFRYIDISSCTCLAKASKRLSSSDSPSLPCKRKNVKLADTAFFVRPVVSGCFFIVAKKKIRISHLAQSNFQKKNQQNGKCYLNVTFGRFKYSNIIFHKKTCTYLLIWYIYKNYQCTKRSKKQPEWKEVSAYKLLNDYK